MVKTAIVCLLLSLALAAHPRVFRGSFLQIDDDFEDEWEAKEGPLVDPPAGHGLPEFSAPPYELTPEEMFSQYKDWQALEAAAEDEFFGQTDAAIADAEEEYDDCVNQYTTEEDIAACQAEAEEEEEEVYRAVEDLQSSHAQEEELVEAAMKFIVEKWYEDQGLPSPSDPDGETRDCENDQDSTEAEADTKSSDSADSNSANSSTEPTEQATETVEENTDTAEEVTETSEEGTTEPAQEENTTNPTTEGETTESGEGETIEEGTTEGTESTETQETT